MTARPSPQAPTWAASDRRGSAATGATRDGARPGAPDATLSVVRAPARLDALRRAALLDTPPEAGYDQLAQVASRVLQAPIALVSLVDDQRQFFKSCVGLPEPLASLRGTPLGHSFCRHVVTTSQPLVIADAREDALVKDSPLIQQIAAIAYLGVPLTTADGHVLGTLCVIDHQPRHWTEEEVGLLQHLGSCVLSRIELGTRVRDAEAAMHDRARVEDALRRSEERYRVLYDDNPTMYFTVDPDGTVESVNNFGAAELGYTPAELVGGSVLRVFLEADRPAAAAQVAQCLAHPGQVFRWELRKIRKDGTMLWVKETARAVSTPDGRPVVFIMCDDITERKKAERELAESRQFLRQVIDLNPSLIFVKDRHGRFTLVNQALAELYGTTAEGAIGRCDADFNPHPDEVARYRADDQVVLSTGQPRLITEESNTDARTGATRWFQVIKVPFRSPDDGAVSHVLGVATDITQRKELESQLRQAQKMEAVGQLAGGIAHDFNNLLTAILGFGSLLLRDSSLTGSQRSAVQDIRETAERAAALTQQLLAFGRRQVLRPQVLDLNDVVRHMEVLLRRVIGEHIELVTALAPDLDLVQVDQNQLEQVIINLAVNARDAMPGGGRLTIATANAVLDDEYAARNSGARPGPSVVLTVTDTGTGMDAETQSRIFEPFFTTKAQGRGTGLGLAVVYGIVKQSGGWIGVSSAPGHGSSFRIHLPPAAAATGSAPSPAAPRVGGVPRGTETVLLVEDEATVRAFARQALESCGYRVLVAADPAEALRVAERADLLQLLLTDVVLPGMSGHDLGRQLRRARPGLRVLLTSGYAETLLHERDDVVPDVAFLPKPYTLERLATMVRQVLDMPA